jgi:transcription antitermination protein NusB
MDGFNARHERYAAGALYFARRQAMASTMTTPRKPPIARSAARLGAVQALYQMDIASADLGETLAQFSSRVVGDDFDDGQCGEADYKHLRDVVEGAVREQALIDPTVDKLLDKDWPLHRLDATLRAILRAAAFEIMFKENVPSRVAINEYVNVAGAFFDGEEQSFANGVLNALARQRRPDEFAA